MFSKLSTMASSFLSGSSASEPQSTPQPSVQASAAGKKEDEAPPALSLNAFVAADFAPLCSIPPRDPASFPRRDVPLHGPSRGKLAFVLDNVLSEQECRDMIAATERLGYSAALVNVGYTQLLLPDVRNNTRCMVDSIPQASLLWERIKSHVPATFALRTAAGLNERLRFLRYDPEQQFQPHYDGVYQRASGEASAMTVIVYLNEGFEGGATRFFTEDDEDGATIDVVPRTGSVLIFEHEILHEGSILVKGRKYIMRTDVMFA